MSDSRYLVVGGSRARLTATPHRQGCTVAQCGELLHHQSPRPEQCLSEHQCVGPRRLPASVVLRIPRSNSPDLAGRHPRLAVTSTASPTADMECFGPSCVACTLRHGSCSGSSALTAWRSCWRWAGGESRSGTGRNQGWPTCEPLSTSSPRRRWPSPAASPASRSWHANGRSTDGWCRRPASVQPAGAAATGVRLTTGIPGPRWPRRRRGRWSASLSWHIGGWLRPLRELVRGAERGQSMLRVDRVGWGTWVSGGAGGAVPVAVAGARSPRRAGRP
jgi:hypothetical protein